MGNFAGALGLFTFGMGIIKMALELAVSVALIILTIKAIQALNIYINKNSEL